MNLQKIKKGEDGITTISIVVIIVILFFIIISTVVITLRIDNMNNTSDSPLKYKFDLNGNNYSKEDLINFLESAEDCSNYSFCFTESGNEVSGMVYNKKIHYKNVYEDTYYDYITQKLMIISEEAKTYSITQNDLADKYKNVLANVVLAFLKCDKSKVKYIKDDKFNGFDCIVEKVSIEKIEDLKSLNIFNDKQLELFEKYQNEKVNISYEFWIDKKTGLLPRYDIVIESVDKKENRIEYDTNLVVGNVKEGDIVFPVEEELIKNGYKTIK